MTPSADIRKRLIDSFRRDLVGPYPEKDPDLARERLNENPSRWYLTGFLAPKDDSAGLESKGDADPGVQEDMELDVEEPDTDGAGGAAGDAEEPEPPNARRRFLPSSIGLTVLLDPDVAEIGAHVSWGDYRTEPPLPEEVLMPEPPPDDAGERGDRQRVERPRVDWVRAPKERTVRITIRDGRGDCILIPESAAEQRRGGALVLDTHSRVFEYTAPDGSAVKLRALTVFLVNRRSAVHRFYADVCFVFQTRLELACAQGFRPRRDISGYRANDLDLRIADLHYRDAREWAVGRNAAAGWEEESGSEPSPACGPIRCHAPKSSGSHRTRTSS